MNIQPAPNSQSLFDRACAVTPGGVNSPVRAFKAVGGTPLFMVSGEGAYITDADNRTYVDLVGSWGPMILGHKHPQVIDAIQQAVSHGTSFGTPGPGEVELAEEIVRRIKPVEQVRLVSSGTEATMSAIRLARGFTGRTKVVKFIGCYHGHVDALLAAAGSGVATLALPDSSGVSASTTADTIVLPYNDVAAVEQAFALHGDDIACLITEAAAANMGVVPPASGFNRRIAEIAHQYGALFISDEVMTGFRVSQAGWYGLEAVEDGQWAPDLLTFGKVMGGGLPAAAFGGRADIMQHLAPTGSVYQAGTLSGNPIATVAGVTTLRLLDAQVYDRLNATAAAVQALVSEALTTASVAHTMAVAGNLFSIFFTETPVTNYAEAKAQESFRYSAFFHEMLNQGVYLPPSAFEAWFVSNAHSQVELDKIAQALPAAARAAAAAKG